MRDDLESTSDIRKLTEFMGKDGKVRPREMPKAQGKRTDLVAACNQVDDTPTLSELGINKTESHRWQQIASVPEEKFEEYIETANEITQAGLLRIARGSNGEPLPEFEAEAKGRQKHYARTHSRSDDQESGSENLSRDQAARVFGVSGPRLDE